MIKLKGTYQEGSQIKVKEIVIKTEWAEVTYDEYCKLVSNTNPDVSKRLIKNISILTGLTVKEVKSFSEDVVGRLATMIAFSRSSEELFKFNTVSKDLESFDLGMQSYGKILAIKKAYNKILTEQKDPIYLGKMLCKMFLGEDIGKKPIIEVLGKANFFLAGFLSSLNHTKPLANGSIRTKKSRRGLRSWVKDMATSLPLITLPMG